MKVLVIGQGGREHVLARGHRDDNHYDNHHDNHDDNDDDTESS